MSSSITPSALFRSIDLWKPTLLIDETDACLKDNEELRGLINCGHTRDSAFTIRCVGDDHTPTKFNVWGAKALSGIGKLADTLLDRSIILELRRKLPQEKVERIRHAEPLLFQELSAKLARFAIDNSTAVCISRPTLPPILNDRAQDNWEPLLSVATVASDDWYDTAVATALKIAGSEEQSVTIGAELLSDIQDVFRAINTDRISTTDLIKHLVSDEERPWAGYNKGFPIRPKQIASRLGEYKIHSKLVRVGTDVFKGFDKNQFTEAFSRYIPTNPISPVTELQTSPIQGLRPFPKGYKHEAVTDKKTCESAPIQACNRVTGELPLLGNDEVCAEIITDNSIPDFDWEDDL